MSSGQVSRHSDLSVLCLGPKELSVQNGSNYHEAAVAAVIQCRPHILVLDEALELGDAAWKQAFDQFIGSEELRSFRGAVVVCAATETSCLRRLCLEHWVITGGCVRQQPCLEVIENALDTDAGAEHLLKEALAIDYCDLSYWIGRARERDWAMTAFFASGCSDGPALLRGLIFHHMIECRAEFHVRFIFVPKPYRGCGLGGRLVRWVIDAAAQMPQSLCRWISLDAADDDLVDWYEKFGFTDMSCGHTDGDYGQTWMEMKNVSLVSDSE